MPSFWTKLHKPFFVLAPMADVTDVAFREIIAKYGKPDVFFTEFVSADGLMSLGRKALLRDLAYTEKQRPIVAQLFTSKPEKMRGAAALVRELGFDGVDINMGCPDRKVEKQSAGAALIKNPKLALELVAAAKDGARDIPVSVKTRTGYHKDQVEEWIGLLLSVKPSAITTHARTRSDMSKVPARWENIKQAVNLRDDLRSDTLIMGNGDVKDMDDARAKARETGADGIMLGRAIFGRPWLFKNSIEYLNRNEPEVVRKILGIMLEHTRLFEKMLGGVKNFSIMKKHYKAYADGFPGAKGLRIKLMETKNADEVEAIVKEFVKV